MTNNEELQANNIKLASLIERLNTKAIASTNNLIRAVLTADEMYAILANSTDDNVGSYYMYLGEINDDFNKGSIYRIGIGEV